nr:MAG TPA: PORTAL PROTEIN [Caudoviricetes sp.]
MYTLPKDTKINAKILNDVIKYNEEFKKRYDKLERYYLGKHDIVERKKGDISINNKVMVNHAKYITDTNIGYLLGNPVDYQVNDEYNIGPILKEFNKQTISDLDSEIAKDLSIFGVQHEYVYVNEKSEPKSCEIDNRNAIVVYDDTVEHNKLFGLIYRPIYKGKVIDHYEVIYCDNKEITTYECKDKVLNKIEKTKTHVFGDVPLIEYKNNPEYLGDFEEVISLIDAYNILQSDRINDKEQLVDAILCLYNMDFTPEQAEMLKETRMLSSIPEDSKVEYLIKQLNEQQVDILRQNIERDIHKISMTPNMSDENFVGNASGVALRYKLLAFEQNIKNKSRYMEKGLKERFRLYNNFLSTNSKMELIPIEEVDVVFTRNLPSNDFEISQMINNLTDLIDRETLISQLSFIKDASDIIEAKDKEDKDREDNSFNINEIPDVNDHKESIGPNIEE